MAAVQAEDDYNLQDAWDRVCMTFAQTTKVDLTTAPKYSVDEVLEQIRAKQDEDDEKNNKYKTAKDVIGKTLNFVMVLGGIAAQGASMVFAPAGLCFNAISYLISTGAKYKRIFSSLTELFRRVSDVLERCKIYLRLPANAIDVSLRRIINDELVCFVDICALSIKVLKGHKVFTALKVFAFDSDEGVSGQLARLAELVERESQMRATLGFESQKTTEKGVIENREGTRKINATVDKLLNFEKKKDADNVTKRLLDGIDSNLDTASEVFKTVQTNYRRLLNDQVQGSGKWLRSNPMFTQWLSPEHSSLSVLGISGGEGYGKSFLFASMIQHLQERHSQPVDDDMTCISTAYYIFDQEKKMSLIQALKVLAWQVANKDIVYRKDISSAKTEGINQVRSIWNILFAKSYKSDSTFFFLLDGVDQVNNNQLKEFVHLLAELHGSSVSWPRFKLRILLSGRDETIAKIKGHMGDGLSVIDVASQNGEDMQSFIIDRMNKMEIMGGTSDQVLSLRREILENLTTQTHGDFVNVGLLLHEISGKQRPGEIRDILTRSGGKRSDTIVRKMEQLNETLSDDDISDLNILLTWVVFAAQELSLDELEAVLFLKTGESSLRPLAEKITDQYSSIFKIKGEPHPTTKIIPPISRVTLVSDSIEQFLRTKSDSDAAEDPQELNLTGDVNEVEVRIVRRFLESVCDPKLFNKFGFDEFFQRKLKGKTARVGVDVETAHLRILTTCLEVVRSPDRKDFAALSRYASICFPLHLNETDPSLTQPQHKTALGPQLVSLFTDEKIMEGWWTSSNPWPRFGWIYDDEYAEVALKWLQDSAVTKNLSDEQSKWVKSLSSKSEPDADILEHIAKYIARCWLQLGAYDIAETFAAVYGYITKIENRKNPEIKRFTKDPEPEDIDASQILDAAEWARKQLGLDSFGYEENRNLARTLREYAKHQEAIERFKLASSLEKYNWFSQWGLATSYANQKEYSLAIETLEDAINTVSSGDVTDDKDTLPEMRRDLANFNQKGGNLSQAYAIYEKILHENPDDYDTALDIMLMFHEDKNYKGLLEFLDSLKNSIDESTKLDRRTTAFHAHYANDDYHKAMFALGTDGKVFDIIQESYKLAITAAEERLAEGRKQGNIDEELFAGACLALLMHNLALLCYQESDDNPERRTSAIDHWVRVLDIQETTQESYLAIMKAHVRTKLANVCFKEARRDASTSASYLEKLEELAAFNDTEGHSAWRSGTHSMELLARFHALQGDETKAKEILRTHVKRSIDILSDDDPLNDWQGYQGLARFFMFAGQDADCLAAWSLIVPFADAEKKSDSSQLGESQQLKGPLFDICDGACGTEWTYADDIYVCRECDYVEFDLDCLNKLREGSLDNQVCGKDHQMLHVPAYDLARHQEIGEGNVRVGEEIIAVIDWLQRIKEQWGIGT